MSSGATEWISMEDVDWINGLLAFWSLMTLIYEFEGSFEFDYWCLDRRIGSCELLWLIWADCLASISTLWSLF